MMNMEHYVTGVAMVIKVENNLRPRNKGRKPASLAGSLTCKHNDAEDAESTCRRCPRGGLSHGKLLVNQPAGGEGG